MIFSNTINKFSGDPAATAFFEQLFGGYFHMGIYRPESLTLTEACEQTTAKMVRLIPKIAKSTKMLVVGSQLGATVMALEKEFGCKIECLDPTTDYNQLLEKKIAAEGMEKKVGVSEGVLSSFPFDRESFDIVWAQDTMLGVEKKAKLFREVQRVLTPKGRFVFTSLVKKEGASEDALATVTDLLELDAFPEVANYQKFADRALLLKVYTAMLSQYLPQHLAELRGAITAPFPSGLKKSAPAFLKSLEQELSSWENAVKQDALDWGLLIFQKINA